MGAQIQAGQILVAGTGPGQLNQYYAFADTTSTTVTAASFANLSTPYVIPAGEADYAGVAYELCCAGVGTQGSTQQTLSFVMYIGGGLAYEPELATTVLSANQSFNYSICLKLTCGDGVSAWSADLLGTLVNSSTTLLPGTAGQQAVALASAGPHTAAVSSAITVAIQCKWGSTTGAPTITNQKTTWRKIS
jgi:hypothetical protein